MSRILRSEAATNGILADTARAPRVVTVDPAVIDRTRAAVRRHRAKRKTVAALLALVGR